MGFFRNLFSARRLVTRAMEAQEARLEKLSARFCPTATTRQPTRSSVPRTSAGSLSRSATARSPGRAGSMLWWTSTFWKWMLTGFARF